MPQYNPKGSRSLELHLKGLKGLKGDKLASRVAVQGKQAKPLVYEKEKSLSEIVIFGAGGHAVSVMNVAVSAGYSVTAYVDDDRVGGNIFGIPIVSQDYFKVKFRENCVCVAIGDNSVREKIFSDLQKNYENIFFPSLVHASSVIGLGTTLSEGVVVMPLSNVGPNSSIGKGCIVNSRSNLDHDCEMEAFSSLAPGVTCGGGVTIGSRTALSLSAVVRHDVKIGSDVVIGAGSYVHQNIADNVVAFGTPCRVQRTRTRGDRYLA